jgi:uncharacterized protein (TIGR03118 family)
MTIAKHRDIRGRIKGIAIGTIALLTMTVAMLSTSVTAPKDGFLVFNLVSDLPGLAKFLDPDLVNPWGVATSSGSPFWVADNNAGLATLYNTQGTKQGLRVTIPNPVDFCDAVGTPTGTVFNIDGGAAGGFPIMGVNRFGAASVAPAIFLFATEDGTIVGWNPGVNPALNPPAPAGCDPQRAGTFGIIAVDNSGNNFTNPDPASQTGAVYKGLAIATDANGRTLLYATNFRAGRVDVFAADFGLPDPALPAGAFTDPSLPDGYAPFNIVEINGKLVVTYAKQDANKHDDVAGQSHGFVNIFDLDGSGLQRLAQHGQLNSPWGVAVAPAAFGELAGDLLIGNFGNGHINAFDMESGQFLGKVRDPDGQAIAIDGLWTLRVGNGKAGGDTDKVYFTAGLMRETHGLFGSICSVQSSTCQ